jgi:hypothetical protein
MGNNGAWVLIIVVALLLLWVLTRNRRPRTNKKLDTVIGILSDVNYNLKIVEIRSLDKLSKKNFRVTNWPFYKEKLDFIPDVVATLDEGFKVAGEYRTKIDVAKKAKALESLEALDLEKVKTPMAEGKKVLVTWLRDNVNNELQANTRRNWLGF